MCATTGAVDHASSAVNVFVTGQPGIGKTTLVLNVAKQLPQDCIAGFYTVEAKAEGTGERLGLDVVTFSGERVPLCRLRRGCGPKIGKYYVAISEFERVVLPQITPSKNIKLHIIDEIGRLELCSDKFREAVFKLLDSPRAVFGSIPAPRYGHTLEEVEQIKHRNDTAVLTLTKANRAITSQEVTELLRKLIQDAKDQDDEDEGGQEGGGERSASNKEENSAKEDTSGSAPGQEGHHCSDHRNGSGHPGEHEHGNHQSSSSEDEPQRAKPLQAAMAQVADAILGD